MSEEENAPEPELPVEKPKRQRKAKAPEGPAPTKRVEITYYKVYTSAGRRLEGDKEDLPGDEADALIAEGKAKEC